MGVQVASEDVLRALKKFKRLAKQDILASDKTPNPAFWRVQAESRRRTYDQLMTWVETEGVAKAYELAVKAYAKLPLQRADEPVSPDVSGQRQGLELFFHVLGKPIPGRGSITEHENPPMAAVGGRT